VKKSELYTRVTLVIIGVFILLLFAFASGCATAQTPKQQAIQYGATMRTLATEHLAAAKTIRDMDVIDTPTYQVIEAVYTRMREASIRYKEELDKWEEGKPKPASVIVWQITLGTLALEVCQKTWDVIDIWRKERGGGSNRSDPGSTLVSPRNFGSADGARTWGRDSEALVTSRARHAYFGRRRAPPTRSSAAVIGCVTRSVGSRAPGDFGSTWR